MWRGGQVGGHVAHKDGNLLELLDADTPLMQAGIYSRQAVALAVQLNKSYGIPFTADLIFEHPTPRAIVAYLTSQAPSAMIDNHEVAAIISEVAVCHEQTGQITQQTSKQFPLGSPSSLPMAEQGPEPVPPLLRLRYRLTAERQPPVVYAHSVLGDHHGSEPIWSLILPQSDVYTLRHRILSGGDAYTLDPVGTKAMVDEYARACVATFTHTPFDLMGASFGALLAQKVAHAAIAFNGCPRRLVLIDPPPAVPKNYPMPKMATSFQTAAMGVLLIQMGYEMGMHVWKQVPQLRTLPEKGLAGFLAAQCLPEGASKDNLVEATDRFGKLMTINRQCRYAAYLLCANIAEYNVENSPDILMVLSTQRWETWKEVFPGIAEDDVAAYGPAVKVRIDGQHVEMVNRCLGGHDAYFTSSVERFLADSFEDAWWWVSSQRKEEGRQAVRPNAVGLKKHGLKGLLSALTTMQCEQIPPAPTVDVMPILLSSIKEVAGRPVDLDFPLEEVGLDSFGAIELHSRLAKHLDLQAGSLPHTLVFDFPTLRQIERHLSNRAVPAATEAVAGSQELYGMLPLLALPAEDPKRCSGSLRLLSSRVGSTKALFAVAMINGRAGDYLTSLAPCTMYALECEYLHTGAPSALEQWTSFESIGETLAHEVIMECLACGFEHSHVIGTSFGSMLAHHVVRCATKAGGTPRALVMIDPFPPPPYRWQSVPPVTMRDAVKDLEALRLMSYDEDDEKDPYADIAEEEMGIILAHRLSRKGLNPFSFESVVKLTRELRVTVANQHAWTLYARQQSLDRYTNGPILAVVASERTVFYGAQLGSTPEECHPDKLSQYGDIECLLCVDGEHMDVCRRCYTNQVPEFTQELKNFLDAA